MQKGTGIKYPATILIKSDGNILEFQSMEDAGKIFVYKYIKSITKKGNLLKMTEPELIKLIKIHE